MDPRICTRCGVEIEEAGLTHRKRLFCSDECCETWEDEFHKSGEPDAEDLNAEDLEEDVLDDDDLDFDEDSDFEDEDDDDF